MMLFKNKNAEPVINLILDREREGAKSLLLLVYVTSPKVGFKPLRILPHCCQISRSYLVPAPNY